MTQLFPKINILVVEDEAGDFILTREMLRHFSVSPTGREAEFDLTWAATFASCLEFLNKQKFDLVLLDLSLPDAQGLDAFYCLRAVAPSTPVIILTGFEDAETAFKSVEAGAQDYLIKGRFKSEVLARSIYYSLKRNQILEELQNVKGEALQSAHEVREFLAFLESQVLKGTRTILATAEQGSKSAEIEKIRAEALSTCLLLETSINFLKVMSGSDPLVAEPVSLDCLFESLQSFYGGLSAAKMTFVRETNAPAQVNADAKKLKQILEILIEEAARADIGGKGLTLNAGLMEPEESGVTRIRFEILVDTTPGRLSLAEQQVLFESFSQAVFAVALKYGLRGLRLALASRLAVLMKGRIWIEARENGGVIFHLNFKPG